MPTLEIQVELSVDDLVKAVQKLEDDDFERFMHTIQWVASKRMASSQGTTGGGVEDQSSAPSEGG